MRTFKCDVCGKYDVEGEIGKLTPELRAEGLEDACRACVKAIGDAMQPVEAAARKQFVLPLFEAAEREEQKLHRELVIPAGKAAIEVIRGGNGKAESGQYPQR